MKTNATRILDKLGIAYETRSYPVDPDDLTVEKVALGIGMPIEKVFKTLVAKGDKHGVLLAVVPGDVEVDLKALARLSEDKRVDMVHLNEVQPLTGYVRGGVTALACKKDYPVFVDISIEKFDTIAVSAGMRGLQILLAPKDYIQAVKASVGQISREKSAP
jgi:Cys-tRNA(Pro)/Cys-tRNA(Cys) deacylase